MFAIYIVCVVLAGLAVALRTVQYLRMNLNTEGFVHQIKRLVAAQNIERAIKLCNAVPHAAISRISRELLEKKQSGASAGELHDAYQSSLEDSLVEIAKGAAFTNLALAMAVIALALPSQETGIALVPSLIAPLAIASVAALLVLGFRSLRSRLSRAGESLVSELSA
jgi:hypothetical protein